MSPPRSSVSPKVPGWLPKEAKAEWKRVVPILTQRRILTDADLGSLENYCLAIGQVRQCQTEIRKAPSMFVQSERSAPRPHPAYRLMHESMRQARQLAAELGLTPVSRSRPSIAEPAEDDDWSGLVDE